MEEGGDRAKTELLATTVTATLVLLLRLSYRLFLRSLRKVDPLPSVKGGMSSMAQSSPARRIFQYLEFGPAAGAAELVDNPVCLVVITGFR